MLRAVCPLFARQSLRITLPLRLPACLWVRQPKDDRRKFPVHQDTSSASSGAKTLAQPLPDNALIISSRRSVWLASPMIIGNDPIRTMSRNDSARAVVGALAGGRRSSALQASRMSSRLLSSRRSRPASRRSEPRWARMPPAPIRSAKTAWLWGLCQG